MCCLLERWKEEGGDTSTLRVNSSFKYHPDTLKLGQEGVYGVVNRLRVQIPNSVRRLLNYDPEKVTSPPRSERAERVSVLSITAQERGRGRYMNFACE